MKRYELIEHTADIGIKAYGRDYKELFCNAAFGLYEQIADLSNVELIDDVRTEVKADDYDELLVLWLGELLYQYNGNSLLLKEFFIEHLDEKHIISVSKGEPITANKHTLKKEVKAVTFHNVDIREEDGYLTTEIIFDV